MTEMENLSLYDIYGSMVFNDRVMSERLPKAVYRSIQNTIHRGETLDPGIAETVANTMMIWAIEKGATHFTHWFQPLTGSSAEKHDSFISPTSDGRVIMEFSGKELIKGESDASSFPSGGLRSTFEARGYTAWDCTSPAFVKEHTLYIPTIFLSYTGEALDQKAPLMRSCDLISREALRVLRCFGNTTARGIVATAGAEQEYFLIDRELYEKRPDLIFTGSTLFGAKPPKGQELSDHYFGNINERVHAFMKDVDVELWKLGISAKTEHNEAAPSQHELAPIFSTVNIATDHNQLTMELLKKVALRHGLVCLLHEKPFAGVNGSGKHNNWSLATDTGVNLFEPGATPQDNAQFIVFLCSVISAVDKYADLLRASVATASNDKRLGGGEAPPAIISIFLGDQLTDILEAIANGKRAAKRLGGVIEIGVSALPPLPLDTSDRNRTSPFAFTGNKFEFRMPGSSDCISFCNTVLNCAVAETLRKYADRLEKAEDVNLEVKAIVRDCMRKHKKVLYNGNSYSEEWRIEAERRGLWNLPTAADALPRIGDDKNVALLSRGGVLSKVEVASRVEILLQNYNKAKNIEVRVMTDMVKRQIMPACLKYAKFLSDTILSMRSCSPSLDVRCESELLADVKRFTSEMTDCMYFLEKAYLALPQETLARAEAYRDQVIPAMEQLRAVVDSAESVVARDYWPLPTYEQLLFDR